MRVIQLAFISNDLVDSLKILLLPKLELLECLLLLLQIGFEHPMGLYNIVDLTVPHSLEELLLDLDLYIQSNMLLSKFLELACADLEDSGGHERVVDCTVRPLFSRQDVVGPDDAAFAEGVKYSLVHAELV